MQMYSVNEGDSENVNFQQNQKFNRRDKVFKFDTIKQIFSIIHKRPSQPLQAESNCLSIFIIQSTSKYTVPVKSKDTPTHSRVSFIFTILYIVQ